MPLSGPFVSLFFLYEWAEWTVTSKKNRAETDIHQIYNL